MGKSKHNPLLAMMHEDLMEVYRKVAKYCTRQDEAWKRVVKHPAKRFYVGAKNACEKVGPLLDGDTSKLEKMDKNRQRLYLAIFEKVKEFSQRREFAGKSLWYIMPFVVNSPAPEFFISPTTAGIYWALYKELGADFCLMEKYPSADKTTREKNAKKRIEEEGKH